MIKFLRKYNKWLLGVGGSLLMVTFLLTGQQSIFQPNPMKQVVATVGSENIRRSELANAEAEYEGLKELWAFGIQSLGIESGAHWMLLKREAEAAGLVGGEGDGRRMREEIAEIEARQIAMYNRGVDPEKIRAQIDEQMRTKSVPRAAGVAHESLQEFERTLSYLRGVVRLKTQYAGAVRVSDVRGVAHLKENFDGVVVDGLVIPAERLIASVPEPTPEQVQEQYQTYRDVKAGSGEFGFGYLQPPRVKFEYITLDRAAFRNAVSLDPVAVSKFFQQNRAKYPGDEAAETARVQADLTNVKADQMMSEADRLYTARLKPDVRSLPQDNGFRVLPPDWASNGVRMAALNAAITSGLQAQGTPVTATVTVRDQGWTHIEDLGRELGIGKATYRVGTNTGDFKQLVSQIHELDPKSPLTLQSRLPYETYLTESGTDNRYYVNILDWRPESAPESIEEVRSEVVRDLKLKAAFDRLKSMADDIRSQAISEGLDAVAKEFPTPAALGAADPTPQPLPVFRYANVNKGFATGELNQKEIREAVLKDARGMGPQMVPTPDNLPQRTITVPVPSKLSLGVVQVLGMRPITSEVLRQIGRREYDNFAQQELQGRNNEAAEGWDAPDPFSFEQMSRRYSYTAVRDESLPNSKRKQ